MRRFFAIIAVLLIILIGLAFSVLNSDPVSVDIFFAELDVALSVALVITLILGAALGVLTSLNAVWRRRREVSRLRRQLTYAERQLQAMRRVPLEDGD
ncbi:MAG: LapA family protein [Halorhodospira sp.]